MIGSSAYGQTAHGAPITAPDVLLSCSLETTSSSTYSITRLRLVSAPLSTEQSLSANVIRIRLLGSTPTTESALSAKVVRLRFQVANLTQPSVLNANLNAIRGLGSSLVTASGLSSVLNVIWSLSSSPTTASELTASMTIPVYLSSTLDTGQSLDAVLYVYIGQLEFTGDLAPGESLVIDTEDLLVLLDDVNARKNFEGEWLKLISGTNKLEYTDSESSRDLELEVKKKDRSI